MGFNVHVTDLVDETVDDSLQPFAEGLSQAREPVEPTTDARDTTPTEPRT